MKKLLVAGAFFLLPTLASAAVFAQNPLFLSKSPVEQGDTVHIYAVVADNEATNFAGTVVISDGTASLGSTTVSIVSGGTQTVSVKWTPSAGSHTVTAVLTASDGTIVQTQSATFVINAPPAPLAPAVTASDNTAAVGSSQPLQQDIANYSPGTAQAAKPLFTVIDGLRSTAADAINTQLTTAENNLSGIPNPVASLSSLSLTSSTSAEETPAVPNTTNSFWFIVWTAYLYVLTILLWIINNAAVFYPLLVIIFFYLLWKMYRAFRRPSY